MDRQSAPLNEVVPSLWLYDSQRGVLPREFVFASTDPTGEPDDSAAFGLAKHAATMAYVLGFDVRVEPRIVASQRIPGSFVLTITRPEG